MSSFWPEEADLRAIPVGEPTPEADYLKLLKRLTTLFDRAMGDEGIPSRTRDRVVSRVLHGTPTPGDTADWAETEDLAMLDSLAAGAPSRRFVAPVDGVA